jgi:hypothetical protein
MKRAGEQESRRVASLVRNGQQAIELLQSACGNLSHSSLRELAFWPSPAGRVTVELGLPLFDVA